MSEKYSFKVFFVDTNAETAQKVRLGDKNALRFDNLLLLDAFCNTTNLATADGLLCVVVEKATG